LHTVVRLAARKANFTRAALPEDWYREAVII